MNGVDRFFYLSENVFFLHISDIQNTKLRIEA